MLRTIFPAVYLDVIFVVYPGVRKGVQAMRRKVARGTIWLLLFLVIGLIGLALANAWEAQRRSEPIAAPTLSSGQKAQVRGALRMQRELGEQIWPGLSETDVPAILFNDRYEFLVGHGNPTAPWEVVAGDEIDGRPYYRRAANDPQSFAVRVGSGWAASLGSMDLMNRELLLNLRRDLPPGLAQLVPYPLATVGRDFGQTALLHEIFHVHQAGKSPQRFEQSEALYRHHRGNYPYADQAFATAWNREGELLAAALKAPDDAETRRLVTAFLSLRRERRAGASLSAELIAMEQEREWLEGTALYVEMRGHELAAAAGWAGFRPGLRWWQTYFRTLEHALGQDDGDGRFYVSGMAMARLLDRLNPDWKVEALQPGITLEQLLGRV